MAAKRRTAKRSVAKGSSSLAMDLRGLASATLDALKPVRVETPAWARHGIDHVFVRGMTGTERDEFELANFEAGKRLGQDRFAIGLRARTVAAHLCDEDGKRMFSPLEDADWIGSLDAATIDRIFDVCTSLSGLTDADISDLEKA